MSIFIEDDISDLYLKMLNDKGIKIIFNKNDEIISQGKFVDNLYLIEDGYVKLSMISDVGKMHIIGFCGMLSWFGENFYFNNGGKSNFFVQAFSEVKCLVFRHEMVRSFMANYEISLSIYKSLIKKNVLVEDKIKNLSFFDTRQRISWVLKCLIDRFGIQEKEGILINFPITRQDLADLSSSSIEAVDVFIRKAKNNGMIDRKDGFILIKNRNLIQFY